MEESQVNFRPVAAALKLFLQRFLTIGENRLELLTLEVQEERERLLHAFLLALAVATFGMLAGITSTAAVVVLLWNYPVAVLLALTLVYGALGYWFSRRLATCLREWQTLPASLDQLRKDRICLKEILT